MSDTEPTGDAYEAEPGFPEEFEEVREKRPVTARSIVLAGARTATGLVGVGIAVVTVGAAALLPLPVITATPPSQLVTPVPTAQQLVCGGSILRLADESGADATTASPVGRPSLRFAASTGVVDSVPITSSDVTSGSTGTEPSVISSPPDADDPTRQVLLSGAQAQQASSGDFVGLAAADCGVPTGDSWLSGGATTVGRTTLLSLVNPSEVSATVDIEIFGETGAIVAPGSKGIIVPASGQRVLSLAGFQPDVVSPVVHVTSSGGQVVASLQQSIVRGLRPGGVDIVEATPALSTDTVIPGVLITGLQSVQALRGEGEGYEDVEMILRLFAPGTGQIPATVSVTPEDGAETGTSFALDVEAGRVTDVPIPDLADGNYTIRVQSDSPLLASARATSAAGSRTDFAWFTPAAALEGQAQVTVAQGPSPVLHLSNPTDADAEVSVAALGGSSRTVVVPAGASSLVQVTAGTTYSLSGFDRVHAAVTVTSRGMVARYGVPAPGLGSAPVTVYP